MTVKAIIKTSRITSRLKKLMYNTVLINPHFKISFLKPKVLYNRLWCIHLHLSLVTQDPSIFLWFDSRKDKICCENYKISNRLHSEVKIFFTYSLYFKSWKKTRCAVTTHQVFSSSPSLRDGNGIFVHSIHLKKWFPEENLALLKWNVI